MPSNATETLVYDDYGTLLGTRTLYSPPIASYEPDGQRALSKISNYDPDWRASFPNSEAELETRHDTRSVLRPVPDFLPYLKAYLLEHGQPPPPFVRPGDGEPHTPLNAPLTSLASIQPDIKDYGRLDWSKSDEQHWVRLKRSTGRLPTRPTSTEVDHIHPAHEIFNTTVEASICNGVSLFHTAEGWVVWEGTMVWGLQVDPAMWLEAVRSNWSRLSSQARQLPRNQSLETGLTFNNAQNDSEAEMEVWMGKEKRGNGPSGLGPRDNWSPPTQLDVSQIFQARHPGPGYDTTQPGVVALGFSWDAFCLSPEVSWKRSGQQTPALDSPLELVIATEPITGVSPFPATTEHLALYMRRYRVYVPPGAV